MLSRVFLRGSPLFRMSTLKLHPSCSTSAVVASDKNTGHSPDIPREYPNPTSKRDFKNYPKLYLRETPPPCRFLFIPESFFTFMYPKTGYTGFHMFLLTTIIYFTNHETFTCNPEFVPYLSEMYLITIVYYKYGDKIGALYDKYVKDDLDNINTYQENTKAVTRNKVKSIKKLLQMKPAVHELAKVNTDIIHLQLENAFRDRILTVHKQVKRKLDCFFQLENSKNVIVMKYMKDFIMKSVMSAITPELEKSVLQKSINDLNALASRA